MIGTLQPLPTPVCRCWSRAEVGGEHQRCVRYKSGDFPYLVMRNRMAGGATWLSAEDVSAGLVGSTSRLRGRAIPGGRPSCRRAGDAGPGHWLRPTAPRSRPVCASNLGTIGETEEATV